MKSVPGYINWPSKASGALDGDTIATTRQVDTKQDKLTSDEQTAVDSGITADLTTQITTNKNDIAKLEVSDVFINMPITSMEEAEWSDIKEALTASTKPSWLTLGATKSLTLANGDTYTIRICDMTKDRYAVMSGIGSDATVDSSKHQYAVLEFAELYKDTMQMNLTAINVGGYPATEMAKTNILTIWNLLPEDFKAICLPVKILSNGGQNHPTTDLSINAQILLPSVKEIFGTRNNASYDNEINGGQYGLYLANNTNDFRIKKRHGSAMWWLRSPHVDGTTNFCIAADDGSLACGDADIAGGVAPCFAI